MLTGILPNRFPTIESFTGLIGRPPPGTMILSSGSGRILRAQDEESRDDPVINQRLPQLPELFLFTQNGGNVEKRYVEKFADVIILSHQVSELCAILDI